jgi:hypothetical protein
VTGIGNVGSTPTASTMIVKDLIDALSKIDPEAEVWFDENHTNCPIVRVKDGFVVDDGEELYTKADFNHMDEEEIADVVANGKPAAILLDWDYDHD